MRLDMCLDMCLDVCSDMCSDICADMCSDIRVQTSVSRHFSRHVFRCVLRHVFRQIYNKKRSQSIQHICIFRLYDEGMTGLGAGRLMGKGRHLHLFNPAYYSRASTFDKLMLRQWRHLGPELYFAIAQACLNTCSSTNL